MRYIIGLLIAIGLVIALIFVIVSGGNNTDPSKVPSTEKRLQDYANTDATARMIISGPIIANEEHRETRVSVDQFNVVAEDITGYQGSVVDSKSSPNTRESYVSFLRALDQAGFTKGNPDKALADERGYCALGNRYVFELVQDGKTLQRFWATNCRETKTYLGELDKTITLFTQQIPSEYRQQFGERTLFGIY